MSFYIFNRATFISVAYLTDNSRNASDWLNVISWLSPLCRNISGDPPPYYSARIQIDTSETSILIGQSLVNRSSAICVTVIFRKKFYWPNARADNDDACRSPRYGGETLFISEYLLTWWKLPLLGPPNRTRNFSFKLHYIRIAQFTSIPYIIQKFLHNQLCPWRFF